MIVIGEGGDVDDARGVCYRACVEDGGSPEDCRLDCYEAEGDGAAEEAAPFDPEACLSDCLGMGIGEADCSERCSGG